jgi:hypothetical protein
MNKITKQSAKYKLIFFFLNLYLIKIIVQGKL